jgi:hypothetical protein
MIWAAALLALGLVCGSLLLRWGTRWGSTPPERAAAMPGDDWLDSGPAARVVMTRAISISNPPEKVWPWLAQLGRGAGWYSVDWLDNGRRRSAQHIVTWIPDPRPGDAAAIGYLRHVDEGRAIAWWVDGVTFAFSRARLVTSYAIEAETGGTRLISRMSADATGSVAHLALLIFRIIDTIMARRQLLGLAERIEQSDAEKTAARKDESGDRDQYQLYEVIFANGETAGVPGKEDAHRWRQAARNGGMIEREDQNDKESR